MEQNIWRLPTVAEAVSSMALHGENAGGVWDAGAEKAVYEKIPDKESPLWDSHSKIIYYWTADTMIYLQRSELRAGKPAYSSGGW